MKKDNGTLYWYGLSGEVLLETNSAGNNPTEYMFFNGQRMARRDPSGSVFYYFEDHLGSSRIIVQDGQNLPCYEADLYPFGGERVITDICPQPYKFTGQERDSESGLDYFIARHYASGLGRFTSPDLLYVSELHIRNPQRWNAYLYVLNNPLRFVDPDGMLPQWVLPSYAELSEVQQELLGKAYAGDSENYSGNQFWDSLSDEDKATFFQITKALEETELSDGTSIASHVTVIEGILGGNRATHRHGDGKAIAVDGWRIHIELKGISKEILEKSGFRKDWLPTHSTHTNFGYRISLRERAGSRAPYLQVVCASISCSKADTDLDAGRLDHRSNPEAIIKAGFHKKYNVSPTTYNVKEKK